MEFVQLTASQSDYFVHDIVFDYYGKRFATCSTDGKIRVWDFVDEENSWTGAEISEVSSLHLVMINLNQIYVSMDVQAHSGAIWRLSWAHPEFGMSYQQFYCLME